VPVPDTPPESVPAAPSPPTPGGEGAEGPEPWDLLLYTGQYVDTIFVHILQFKKREYRHSFVDVVGLARPIGVHVGPFALEAEGNIGLHRGIQQHAEVNGLLVARLSGLGFAAAPASLAIGEGLSLASAEPRLEREDNDGVSNPFLHYLMVEADLVLPGLPHRSRAMLRIHHRSGVFGAFCPRTCGSNFITGGVKIEL